MQRATCNSCNRRSAMTELVSKAEYARMRGLAKSTISREVQRGQIPTVDGRIDPVAADRARNENLDQAKRKPTPMPAAAPEQTDFERGARWAAFRLCSAVRG